MSTMSNNQLEPRQKTPGKWLFLSAFVFSCVLFWWLPSLLFRLLLHVNDPIHNGTIILSVCVLLLFAGAYLLPVPVRTKGFIPESVMNACERFAYRGTLIVFCIAFPLAIAFFRARSGVAYGSGEGIPTAYQAVLYAHLYLGFLYLGLARPEIKGWRPVLIASALITLPRLIISLHWGRFFVAQAVVPIIFIAIARGWVRFSIKKLALLVIMAVALIFVPAITRGDSVGGQNELVQFFVEGSTLRFYQGYTDLDLNGRCPPLLVSLTEQVVPYHALGICLIDIWGRQGLPATLDRLLSYQDPAAQYSLVGTGSNFMLELSLTGGLPMLLVGTAVFGVCCRRMIVAISYRSIYSGIWCECLTRALMTPRGSLGYVFQRVPSLILVTWLIVLSIRIGRFIMSQYDTDTLLIKPQKP